MKSFITALCIAALLVVGSKINMTQLEKLSSELNDINGAVIAALERSDYAEARNNIVRMSEELDRRQSFFAAMGNHSELDTIEVNLSELKSYAEGGLKYDALSKSYALSYLFEHLPKNSRIRLENIL